MQLSMQQQRLLGARQQALLSTRPLLLVHAPAPHARHHSVAALVTKARKQHAEQAEHDVIPVPGHDKKASSVQSVSKPSSWKDGIVGAVTRGAACLAIAAVLMLGNAGDALAARSGGRVGGSGFRSSAPTRSFSSGSSHSYSSHSAPSPSYGRSSGGYGGVYGRSGPRGSTSTTILTSPGIGYGMGYGYGMGFPGSVYRSPAVVVGAPMDAALALALVMMFTVAVAAPVIMRSGSARLPEVGAGPVTVSRLQVGLLANARDMKARLDQIGNSADTSTTEGLHSVLQDATLALLRQPDHCVYASASSSVQQGQRAAERAYNQLVVEERSNFKEETLVNVGGRGVRRSRMSKASEEVDELMVVTLVVATEGSKPLPAIRSAADLRAALKQLGSMPPRDLVAMQLTWTPQAADDALTHEQVLAQYPGLVPI